MSISSFASSLRFVTLLIAALSLPLGAVGSDLPPPLSETAFPSPLIPAAKLVNQGAYDKAAAALRRLQGSPQVDQAQLHYLGGIIERRRGDPAAAAAELRRSLALRGSSSDVLAELGGCLGELGEREQAVRILQEALWFGKFTRYAPWQLYLQIGALYEQDEDSEKAEEAYRQAQALGAGSPSLLKVAEIRFVKGDKRQAVDLLRNAYKKDPENPAVREKLASYLLVNVNRSIDKKDIADALELSEGIMKNKSDAEQYADPAFPVYLRALLASGRIEEADRKLADALQAHPENVEYQRLSQQMSFERKAAVSTEKEDRSRPGEAAADRRVP